VKDDEVGGKNKREVIIDGPLEFILSRSCSWEMGQAYNRRWATKYGIAVAVMLSYLCHELYRRGVYKPNGEDNRTFEIRMEYDYCAEQTGLTIKEVKKALKQMTDWVKIISSGGNLVEIQFLPCYFMTDDLRKSG
jgi:hypothetical protein